MDELILSNELQQFVEAIQGIVDMDEDILEMPEAMEQITAYLKANLTSYTEKQSINQIIQNLEMEGCSREEAIKSFETLKTVIKEMVYGENKFSENKKIIVDTMIKSVFDIFDAVIEKYHNYSIELPMTVDIAGGAKVPTYAHDTDAAADLYAPTEQIIPAHSYGNMIKTGVKIQLPEGWLAMILPRSSIGVKTPLRLSNSVGLIDSGYRGELGVLYDNTSDTDYTVNAGDRIAQLLVMPSYRFQAKVVDILADSDRGETGFGDSGK